MPLDTELLAILACPVCRESLAPKDNEAGLLCARCAVVYPIREKIPVMLAEEAVPLRRWEEGQREAPPV